jgi:hypothetical protein
MPQDEDPKCPTCGTPASVSHALNVQESQRRADWEARNRNFQGEDSSVAQGAHSVMDAVTNQDARDTARRNAEAAGGYGKKGKIASPTGISGKR